MGFDDLPLSLWFSVVANLALVSSKPLPVPDNPVVTHNGLCPGGGVASAPPNIWTNYTIAQNQAFNGPLSLASNDLCTSSMTAECGETLSFTHTVTHGYSIDASAATALGPLEKIFTGTLTIGGSYTASVSDATGTGTGVNCPTGGYHCGVAVQPQMIWFSGTIWQWSSHCNVDTLVVSSPYNITAAQQVAVDGQGDKPIQSFESCYWADSKVPTSTVGFPPCPTGNIVPPSPVCSACTS